MKTIHRAWVHYQTLAPSSIGGTWRTWKVTSSVGIMGRITMSLDKSFKHCSGSGKGGSRRFWSHHLLHCYPPELCKLWVMSFLYLNKIS